MDIGEKVAKLAELDSQHEDKCPFCYKDPHDFPSKKNKPTKKVTSKPSQLGCAAVPGAGKGRYTTAKHHLISALQCYARIPRLVRMGSMVGYDVNDKPNGIGLPTIWNPYDGKKYGDLSEDGKEEIAFQIMEETGAQWHVGHHAFEIVIPNEWDPEEWGDDEEIDHTVSYDTAVIKNLLKIADKFSNSGFCDHENDVSDKLVDEMNKLSKKIEQHLEMYKKGVDMPWKSDPYFVSERAFKYAKKKFNKANE